MEPKFITIVEYKCRTCENTTEAAQGSKLLCQECVNTFLAKNVGLMQENITAPEETDD